MTDKPIIFSASMVRALLEGRKTQTRRVIKPVQPRDDGLWPAGRDPVPDCPHGRPGDRLWVRETWLDAWAQELPATSVQYHYRADPGHEPYDYKWRSSVHMPREASRILLEVTEVRVERVQAISDADAIAEGLQPVTAPNGHVTYQIPGELGGQSPRRAFRLLWEGINGTGSWNANPWVWAISFKVLSAPGWRAAA